MFSPIVLLVLKVLAVAWAVFGLFVNSALISTGHFDRYNNNLTPEKFSMRYQINGTNVGDCALGDRSTCGNNGDCLLNSNTNLTYCQCDSKYYTYDTNDQCGYARRARWFAFTLTLFPGLGAEYFYLCRGDTKYIILGVARIITVPVAVIFFYCTCGMSLVGALGWMVWNAVQLGTNSGYLSYDGNGVAMHSGWVPA